MSVSRRGFLASCAAGALIPSFASRAMVSGAGRVDAAQGSGTAGEPLVVGSGSHRYSCVHEFLAPPPGTTFGDTHGLAQDKSGRIYLAQTVGANSNPVAAVCVYSPSGAFISSWGAQFAGGAHGLDLRDEGGTEFLYHCDTARRVVEKTRLDGAVVWSVGCPMASGAYSAPGEWCPTNVAFAPDGDLFVGDGYGKSFIHRFSSGGEWKSVISRPGSGAGETSCPHGMWVDQRGSTPTLVVADRGNRRIQVLDLDGKHMAFHTNGVRMPCDMKFREGLMLVPDLESVVMIYDEKFAPVVALGDGHPSKLRGVPREQFVPGKFVHPHDAIWLANGDILVAEWVPIGRVTLLRKIA